MTPSESPQPTTYGPNRCVSTHDTFNWSDLGGRSIGMRLIPSGRLDIWCDETDTDRAEFSIAAPDVEHFLRYLSEFCERATNPDD